MSTEWKMVPVEPTPEMVAAAFHGVIEPQDCLAQQRGRERMAEFYRLMLAASPQPAAQPEQPDTRPICSADGCSLREPCGPFCRDRGNFDQHSRRKSQQQPESRVVIGIKKDSDDPMPVPVYSDTYATGAQPEPCMCKDRPKSKCPGEWEPGCDLGANEKFVRRYDLAKLAKGFEDAPDDAEACGPAAQPSRCGLTECQDRPMCEPCREGLRGEKYGPVSAAQPEQPEPGVLTDAHIEFALNCNLEDPSDDESSGFYAGARWAEAFLSTRKLSDEQVARIMEAVEEYAERFFQYERLTTSTAEQRKTIARARVRRLLGGEA